MIEFVYGAKGSGKTKKMIDMANGELANAKGSVLFINDRDKYRATVDNISVLSTPMNSILKEPTSCTDLSAALLQATMMSNVSISIIYSGSSGQTVRKASKDSWISSMSFRKI